MQRMLFKLDEHLASSSFKIYDSTLSEVRLKNNKDYPWIILIPRVANITEIFQLSAKQQLTLMNEMTHLSACMQTFFHADKMNVGALGNIVSQLHIHIIARFKNDLSWPQSVWREGVKDVLYEDDEREKLIQRLREVFA
jgi:diadenosine tetraphosphate (Ap4A) HIT family hydrolase